MINDNPALREILDIESKIDRTKEIIKSFEEEAQGILEGHTAWANLQEAKRNLQAAKEGLAKAMMSDADYNNVLEQIADAKEDKAALLSTLSSMLVAYSLETKLRTLEVNDTFERDINLVGKLGKAHRIQLRITGDD